MDADSLYFLWCVAGGVALFGAGFAHGHLCASLKQGRALRRRIRERHLHPLAGRARRAWDNQ